MSQCISDKQMVLNNIEVPFIHYYFVKINKQKYYYLQHCKTDLLNFIQGFIILCVKKENFQGVLMKTHLGELGALVVNRAELGR
jgi:hypothetical protein